MRMTPIQKAIQHAGGVSALAANIGVTYQAIQQWEKAGRVPAERAIQIERATDGEVTRHELRPDLYPEERVA